MFNRGMGIVAQIIIYLYKMHACRSQILLGKQFILNLLLLQVHLCVNVS